MAWVSCPQGTEAPRFASFCLTEPGAGSDAASIRTTAVKRGDKYVINGSKCFITNGSHADWYSVFAKTDGAAGHRGISAFIVPRQEGVVVDRVEDKLGHRASDTAALSFIDAALELTSAYANERVQFGVPLAEHQGIQFMVADMASDVEAARMLAWRSALLASHRTMPTSRASRRASRSRSFTYARRARCCFARPCSSPAACSARVSGSCASNGVPSASRFAARRKCGPSPSRRASSAIRSSWTMR